LKSAKISYFGRKSEQHIEEFSAAGL